MNRSDLALLTGVGDPHIGSVLPDTAHLDASVDWLLRVQERTPSGGIAGFYSLFRGWYDAYPETTGYIIQTLVDYAAARGRADVLSRAIALGDWEIAVQLPEGGVRAFCRKMGLSSEPMIFDTGQVLFGWIALYRHTREKRFLDAAVNAALWLQLHQDANGRWTRFVYQGHCGTYHARVACAMLPVARESQREDLHRSACAFLRWVLKSQSPSGFFEGSGFRPRGQYFTHAIAYTLEGLFGAARELGDAPFATELVASALRMCDRLLTVSMKNAVLYGECRPDFTPGTTAYVCVPGTAQIAWCFLRAYSYSGDSRYFVAASSLLESVKSMQLMNTRSADLRGSLPASHPIWGRYQRWRIVTWAAKFFADALLEKGRILAASQPQDAEVSRARLPDCEKNTR